MSPTVPISMFVDAPMEEELLPPLEPTPHARPMDRAVMQPKPQPPAPDAARRGTTPHQRVTRLKTLDDVRVALGKLYREARMLKLPPDQAKGLAYLLQGMSTALEDRVALPAITNPAKVGQLEHKQAKFCIEYQVDGNATQAAIRAGYSAKSARQMGTENLSKPSIAAEIARLRAEYARTAGVEIIDVWKRLKAKAFTDLTVFMDENGGLKAPKDWPEDARAALSAYDAGGAQSSEKLKLVDQTPILFKWAERLEPLGAPAPTTAITQNVQVNVDKAVVDLRAILASHKSG